MLRVRDAKPVLALTALFLPWDLFAFGQALGWGLSFSFGRFATTRIGTQFLTLVQLLDLIGRFDPSSRIGIGLWVIASTIAFLVTVWAVVGRFLNGSLRGRTDRIIGVGFMLAGGLFVVSRFLMYEWLLVSRPSDPNWFSIPFGAAYVIFVGAVFYFDWFRLGSGDNPT